VEKVKKIRSKNPVINSGYYQGLQQEIHIRTGITKPVIYKAIRENDTSSPKKMEAIRMALEIIAQRSKGVYTLEEPISLYHSSDSNLLYTYWDYLKWQFEERVELIKGKIFKMAPAPSSGHQTVSLNLTLEIATMFKRQPCRVFSAPFDVRLSIPNAPKDTTVVQPDLCIICDETKIDSKGCNGSPDLIVEILSASNQSHDLNRKFEIYESSGVSEYWIVDPSMRIVFVYTLQNSKFVGLRPFGEGMVVESPLFPQLQIAVENIFYRA